MAPEVWKGQRATAAADVYSFGALMFELLTGKPPHDAESIEALYVRVVEQDAPTVSSRVSNLDPAWRTLSISVCAALSPSDMARPWMSVLSLKFWWPHRQEVRPLSPS